METPVKKTKIMGSPQLCFTGNHLHEQDAIDARVAHQLAEDETDFYKRFRRYGRGSRRLEIKHQLPSLRAHEFKSEKPEHQRLADLSVKAMQEGYDDAIVRTERGILKLV